MIVVIDTSVLVSAAFRDRTPEEVILFVTEQDAFHWIVSDEILAEYREVLSRPKFDLSEEILNHWIEILESSTIEIDVDLEIDFQEIAKTPSSLPVPLPHKRIFLSQEIMISMRHNR